MKINKFIAAQVLCMVAIIPLALAETENPALHGQQVQLPNDVEQKAMYCLAVKKLQHGEMTASATPIESEAKSATDPELKKILAESVATSKQTIAKIDDNINRIQMFLLPRMPHLEATAMLSAYSRGETDFARQKQSPTLDLCKDRCKNTIASQYPLCVHTCMEEDELNRRIFQCYDLSFLPY